MSAPRRSAGLPPDERDDAYTVKSFAAKHAISRSQAFKEIAAGRLIARKVGARTIITREDAAKWRRTLPKANMDASKARNNGPPPWLPGAHRESHKGLK